MMPIVVRLNTLVQSMLPFKKHTLTPVIFSLLLLLVQSCTDHQDSTDSIEQRVQEILSSMTLEQKVGQMIQGEIRFMSPQDVKDYSIGSVLNGGGAFLIMTRMLR